ncbi:carboxyltransferase subunit alpha [Candidatus Gromoviella agglomerans]|uniref:carboxyltransferase subunit alpha n=1 Tax=Candidatus Gromoviella agglomerans TaxID=2806609 RepID=UPI001E53C8E4|nr:carboxyltransferase subunit alpha [Candidatus Gromoviella agglomerans]UFX98449.1 Acetyl-coenzyme A carboxylase carboxyl transferase subunit alpha [Candidatus Gromoviella agglomerans]
MNIKYLSFESEVEKLDNEISSLNQNEKSAELLMIKRNAMLQQIYQNLSPWEKVLVARHENRPNVRDYINGMTSEFFEILGDKCNGNDNAMVCGIGLIDKISVVICGNDKSGKNKTNFGMSHPEGYRKFMRAIKLAQDFKMPIISLVDTPGAFPGLQAEKRGQSYSIARSMYESVEMNVSNISVIIGEGGSGGAIAISLANKVIMLEHSVYSTISPEGCSSILWKNTNYKEIAAKNQKITAQDLLKMGIIDLIIEEPIGGAHRNHFDTIQNVKRVILAEISAMQNCDNASNRKSKFLAMTRNFI